LANFLRFGIIGGFGTIVNLVVFISCIKLTQWAGIDPSMPLISNAFLNYSLRLEHVFIATAFVIANIFNYTMNRRFNFGSNARRNKTGPAKFMTIGILACIIQILIFAKLTRPGPLQLNPSIFDSSSGLRNIKYWGQVISIALVMPINFTLNKFWTFGGENGYTK